MEAMGNPFSAMNGLPVPFSGLKYGGECIINYVNGLVKMVNGHQEANTAKFASQQSQIEGHGVTLANTETALGTEIDALKRQQIETAARLERQKKESDTKIRQLETKLQDLALAYKELMEMVKKAHSDSNSFYAPSEADPSDIEEELNAALGELIVEKL